MTKIFGLIILLACGVSYNVLSNIEPYEGESSALNPPRVQIVPSGTTHTAIPKKDRDTYQSNLPGPSITSELPQQPVYEAPVYVPEWEQSSSGPTTESYPSDITIIPPANPVVNPVLEPYRAALQERIIQIQQHVVEQFMPRQTLSFTLPGVN